MSDSLISVVSQWMKGNARPLDLARWRFHFEGGSQQAVLDELAAFQNPDGGFGNGLEADCWNPDSSPMQTWAATEILKEVGFSDLQDGQDGRDLQDSHDSRDMQDGRDLQDGQDGRDMHDGHDRYVRRDRMLDAMLDYLDHCPYFSDNRWHGTIPSNNLTPHAPWWHFSSEMIRVWNWNPTASLAGFILLYADRDSAVRTKARQSAEAALDWFFSQKQLESFHQTFCFIRLAEYLRQARTDEFDIEALETQLIIQVSNLISQNVSAWQTQYVCKPSFFIRSPSSIFLVDNLVIAEQEASFILEKFDPVNLWEPNWQWDSYLEAWEISKRWWKADIAIKNMRFLGTMGRL